MATIGFEGIGINVWLVWLLPFVGAAIIAAVARAGHRARDYTAVGFALASALYYKGGQEEKGRRYCADADNNVKLWGSSACIRAQWPVWRL